MKSLINLVASVAGLAQAILTFLILLQLKGWGFTLISIFVFPVFMLFPIWGYFLWGFSNPYLWASFFTLLAATIANSILKND